MQSPESIASANLDSKREAVRRASLELEVAQDQAMIAKARVAEIGPALEKEWLISAVRVYLRKKDPECKTDAMPKACAAANCERIRNIFGVNRTTTELMEFVEKNENRLKALAARADAIVKSTEYFDKDVRIQGMGDKEALERAIEEEKRA
jgi:hypothetical protein